MNIGAVSIGMFPVTLSPVTSTAGSANAEPSGSDTPRVEPPSRIDARSKDAGLSNDTLTTDNRRRDSSQADRQLMNGLTQAEIKLVRELATRDREVRAHEQAHANVGGQYAGSPSYTFQQGPDGRRYAVGGEVPIDVSPIPGDPRATIEKARVVARAALAPAQPSPQDRTVAAEANAIKQQAMADLLAQEADTRTQRAGAERAAQGIDSNANDENDPFESYTSIDVRA